MVAQHAHDHLDTALAQRLDEGFVVIHPVLGLRIEAQERSVAVRMVVDVARKETDHIPQQAAVFEFERQGVERIDVVDLEEQEALRQVVALVTGRHRGHILHHVETMALLEDHAVGFESYRDQISPAGCKPFGCLDGHFDRKFDIAARGGKETVVGKSHLVSRIKRIIRTVGLVVLPRVIGGIELGPSREPLGGGFGQHQTQLGGVGLLPQFDGGVRLPGVEVLQHGARFIEARFDRAGAVPFADRDIVRAGDERSRVEQGCGENTGFEISRFHA